MVVLCAATGAIAADEQASADDADLRFFEQRIRPVLASECYECHSAAGGDDDVKAGLYLDTRASLRRGGESGPAIVPGEPEQSRLLQALTYHGDAKMPPEGKLDDHIIDDFAEWIERGAPDPREGDRPAPTPIGGDVKPEDLWSLAPLSSPDVPETENTDWPASDIDRFIYARLDEAGLRPAPAAEKRTLIRRAYYDLVGMPPTPAEIDAFLQDDSSDAFEKVVDRLLASPRFGERWGRHWLDVARFAESSGGSRSRVYTKAWRYRDYVIRALNADMPYDQFVLEQVAGDLLPHDSDEQRRRQIIATGFLTLGPKNLDAQNKALQRMDVVDEQLDSLGQALMGMTFGCARCHDHMFDPISTKDYYALAGIFRSTRTLTPGNINGVVHRDLPPGEELAEAIATYEHKEREAVARVKEARQKEAALRQELGLGSPEGPFPLEGLQGIVVDNTDARTTGDWPESTYSSQHIHKNYQHDDNTAKGEKSITYVPDLPRAGVYEVRLAHNFSGGRASNVPVTIQHAEGRTTVKVNQTQEPPIDGIFVSLGEFHFEEGQDGSVTLSNEGTDGHVIADAIQFIPVDAIAEQADPDPAAETRQELADAQEQVERLEKELRDLRDNAPEPPQAMAVYDHDVQDVAVHISGDVRRLGDVVPRRFPKAITVEADHAIGDEQSGRLELARWLTEPDHPLTARVMVNRIWGHLLGRPIVATPDNFGTRGEPPTHPDLLDHLATHFIDQDYSIKAMIRQIMLSRTYQMAHRYDSAAEQADPDNRLLWRAERRRLDAEAIRDAMLAVSGDLDGQMFGDTLEGRSGGADDYSPESNRRSIYQPVFRSALPEFMDVFDVADPNLVVGHRNVSTVPTQALYLLNSPFVHDRAAGVARRVSERDTDADGRARWLYESLLGRLPSEREMQIAQELLAEVGDDANRRREAWQELAHALLASLEFRYQE